MPNTVKTVNIEQFKDSVFWSLKLSRWPARATCKNPALLMAYLELLNAKDGEAVTAVAVDGAPRNGQGVTAANVTKTTYPLIGECKEFTDLCDHLRETKDRLAGPLGRASQSRIQKGLFVVRKSDIEFFETELNRATDKLTLELIPAFMRVLPDAIRSAETLPVKQGGLGPLFNRMDYPPEDAIEESFKLDWQWLALGVPDDLPESLRAEANAKFQRQMEEAAEEVKQALRVSLGDFVTHLVERLQPGEDGKQKVFRDSLIGNIAQFCEVFDSRNIMNDGELATLVNRAKTLIAGVTPDKLRQYSAVKETALNGFSEIKAQLDTMITERKGRKVSLDD